MDGIIIYGAYGYTGTLIVELAVKRGWKPTIAGRNQVKLKALSEKCDVPYLCFKHNDQEAWDNAMVDKAVLLNCAGPFSLTIKPILSACLRNRIDYLDITGEIDVFDYIQMHNRQAKEAGIVMLPGVGFDVVPTDCLAKYLHEQLPSATHLELAFESTSGLSRGTALSVLNRFHQGGVQRKNGEIESYPTGSLHKTIQFYGKDRLCVGIGWGDVFTAFYSTGIPNIKVFTAMSKKTMNLLQRASKWNWLIRTSPIQRVGIAIIRYKVKGPSKEQREKLKCHIWGKVWDENGNEYSAQMKTPESYKLTAISALLCLEKVLNGGAKPGYSTPAGAFGSNLIMEIEGVKRELIIPEL